MVPGTAGHHRGRMTSTPQIPVGSVVVGYDGSPSSQRALEWAADLARSEHRPITVVHGTPPAAKAWMTAPGYGSEAALDHLRSDAEQLLADARAAVAERAPDLEVTTVHRIEDPRQVLVGLSADAAVVVVGSRGRGPVASLLLGSVGVTLVRHASCPVVVLRPPASPRWGGVLVGSDLTDRSAGALELGFRQAAARGVPLTVLHSWAATAPAPADRAEARTAEREHVAGCRQAVVEAAQRLRDKYPDVPLRIETTRMPPAAALVEAAEGRDLVVVGRRHRPPVLGTVHGSVSAAVVEHAAATVVVVPTP